MPSQKIDPSRIRALNDLESRSDRAYVLYWMRHCQRAEHSEALEFAVQQANAFGLPLLVAVAVAADTPDHGARHVQFMLEGLRETSAALRRRGIGFVLRIGEPFNIVMELAQHAGAVVTDRGYLREHRQSAEKLARKADVTAWQIEGNLVVPVETASDKREFAARTIRSKIQSQAEHFLAPLATTATAVDWDQDLKGEEVDQPAEILRRLTLDRDVPPVDWIRGGTTAAKQRLNKFLDERLTGYDRLRSDVNAGQVSHLSAYLHYGMISPVVVARAILAARQRRTPDIDSVLEELLVRRELAHNFVFYARSEYDQFAGLPDWSRETLAEHQDDPREHLYTAEELEHSRTHDEVWNAAMTQMRVRGYLHNQLRMYWGKKFLEWTNTPEYGYRTLLRINNKYFLDGRDPNSFANVAWVFGLHDRPHPEREVYGKVRYHSRGGLERKFDTDAYVTAVQEECTSAVSEG
jgi:deoxyribodipyrimidine photo-lyase